MYKRCSRTQTSDHRLSLYRPYTDPKVYIDHYIKITNQEAEKITNQEAEKITNQEAEKIKKTNLLMQIYFLYHDERSAK